MAGTKKKTTKNLNKVDVSGSLISLFNAVRDDNLDNVKKSIHTHGLSCHECGNKDYVLLFMAIMLGRVEIVNYLLQEGAKVDCESDSVDTLLHYAVAQESLEIVRLLLEKNAPIDPQNAQGETPLHWAVERGLEEIVDVLLENKTSLTTLSEKGTPLFSAIEGEHEEIVTKLLNYARTNLKTSGKKEKSLLDRILLCNATARDKVDKLIVSLVTRENETSNIVDELVDHGFILSRKYVDDTLLLAAIKKQHVKLIASILKINSQNDATHNLQLLGAAFQNECKKIVNLFLNSGLEVIKKGNTYTEDRKWVEVLQPLVAKGADIKKAPGLLFFAIEKEFVEMCELLIKSGIDVNALNKIGETPLFVSCDWAKRSRQKDKIVKLLLQNKADVNAKIKQDGKCITALHHAALKSRKDAVCLFLNFGVDVDLRAEDESTSLHLASERVNIPRIIVEALCKNGANLEARRGDGCTPLHLAKSADVTKILLKFNADIDARGPNNETPLIRASSDHQHLFNSGREKISILLNNGCDINAENDKGETAIDSLPSVGSPHFNTCVILLKKHATKLSAAGLHVSEKYFDLFESVNHELADFKLKCEAEVNRMTNTQLNPQFTLYDILVNGKSPHLAKNKPLMRILKAFNLDSFPIYGSLIKSNVKRSEFKHELMCKGQNLLDFMLKIRSKLNRETYLNIPSELQEKIVSYLSICELRNLISCGEALKRQLGK